MKKKYKIPEILSAPLVAADIVTLSVQDMSGDGVAFGFGEFN